MDWPTRKQISQLILDAELPSTSSRGDPAWLRGADAILALFEPLRTELEISQRSFQLMLAARAEAIDELATLRPIARAAAAWVDMLDHTQFDAQKARAFYSAQAAALAQAVYALSPDLRARLLEVA